MSSRFVTASLLFGLIGIPSADAQVLARTDAAFAAPPATVTYGPVAAAVTREAARLAIPVKVLSPSTNGQPDSHDAADWSRVIRLQPGTSVVVTHRHSTARERLVVMADQHEIALLHIDSGLPAAARTALGMMSFRHAADLSGTVSTAFVYGSARIDSDGVFVDGVKVADLRDVIEKIARADITAISIRGGSAHTFWGDFGGFFMIGTALATTIAGVKLGRQLVSSHPKIGAAVGSVGGAYLGLGASFWMSDIVTRDRVIYRSP